MAFKLCSISLMLSLCLTQASEIFDNGDAFDPRPEFDLKASSEKKHKDYAPTPFWKSDEYPSSSDNTYHVDEYSKPTPAKQSYNWDSYKSKTSFSPYSYGSYHDESHQGFLKVCMCSPQLTRRSENDYKFDKYYEKSKNYPGSSQNKYLNTYQDEHQDGYQDNYPDKYQDKYQIRQQDKYQDKHQYQDEFGNKAQAKYQDISKYFHENDSRKNSYNFRPNTGYEHYSPTSYGYNHRPTYEYYSRPSYGYNYKPSASYNYYSHPTHHPRSTFTFKNNYSSYKSKSSSDYGYYPRHSSRYEGQLEPSNNRHYFVVEQPGQPKTELETCQCRNIPIDMFHHET